MEWITHLLSSPIWGGIQGVLAVLALLSVLKGPRRWIGDHAITKWVPAVPWVLVFVVSGLAAGLGIWVRFRDIYRGALVAAVTTVFGLAIQWFQSHRSAQSALKELQRKKHDYQRLQKALHRIVQLQQGSQIDYKTDDRTIVHSIGEDGAGLLREELTIAPLTTSIYFHVVRYENMTDGDERSTIDVAAESLSYNTPLTVLELERSSSHGRYAIVVDPPSTIEEPHRIAIECRRKKLWSALVDGGEDEGYFGIAFHSNLISVQFVAPTGRKWKSFRPAKSIGEVSIETLMNSSKVVWNLPNPPIRRYDYKAALE